MSDDTMAQDGFEPRPEMEKPANDGGAAAPDPIEALKAENADLDDRVLRLAAEMENPAKRMEREIADTRAYAITKFARDMLTATDSLSRALLVLPAETRDTADGAMKSLIDGHRAHRARDAAPARDLHGVKPIEAEGQKFDPHRHQAMFEVPDPTRPEGTVVQVVQTGYAIGDRVLRPGHGGRRQGRRAAVSAGRRRAHRQERLGASRKSAILARPTLSSSSRVPGGLERAVIVDGARGVFDHNAVEPGGHAVFRSPGDAIIGGEAAQEQPLQAAFAEVSSEAREGLVVVFLEARIGIDGFAVALADDGLGMGGCRAPPRTGRPWCR